MPAQVVCPSCGTYQDPPELSGDPTCPECAGDLPTAGQREPRFSPSALDEPASGRPQASGSMTLLRNGLRSDGDGPQGGWMENILPRRLRTATGRDLPAGAPVARGPSGDLAGPEPSTGSLRFDPRPDQAPSRSSPPLADGPDVAARSRPKAPGGLERSPGDRPSIPGVLAVVLVGAIGSVALLRGGDPWANLLGLATIGLLGAAILGVLHRRGARRSFWQGFALFGWGYWLLAFGPAISPRSGPELPTSRWLGDLHARVAAPAINHPDGSGIDNLNPGDRPGSPPAVRPDREGEPRRAASMVAVGADLRQFSVVGHCLFTLLAALLGSRLARWFSGTAPDPA